MWANRTRILLATAFCDMERLYFILGMEHGILLTLIEKGGNGKPLWVRMFCEL